MPSPTDTRPTSGPAAAGAEAPARPAPAEPASPLDGDGPAGPEADPSPGPTAGPTPSAVAEGPEDRATPEASAETSNEASNEASAEEAPGAPHPQEQAVAQPPAAVDPRQRPTATPRAPVASASELSAENAGSLSGSRQGNRVTLILPSSAVSQGEWVSVFVFPGGQSPGWVQVDATNSVAIDISSLNSGSYELVVANRDNLLLGWARLEIAEAAYTPGEVRRARVLPGAQPPVGPGYIGPDDWLLLGAGVLVVLGVASFVVAARSGVAAMRG